MVRIITSAISRADIEKPFHVRYRHLGENGDSSDREVTAMEYNSYLRVTERGHYRLLSVRDSLCPGLIADPAKDFEVRWIPRPMVRVVSSPSISIEDDIYIRNPVCEGDEDAVELSFEGDLHQIPCQSYWFFMILKNACWLIRATAVRRFL